MARKLSIWGRAVSIILFPHQLCSLKSVSLCWRKCLLHPKYSMKIAVGERVTMRRSLLGSFVCFLGLILFRLVSTVYQLSQGGFLTLILCFPTNCSDLGECSQLSIRPYESFYLLPKFENAAEPL